jgi:group I intron endonuclease
MPIQNQFHHYLYEYKPRYIYLNILIEKIEILIELNKVCGIYLIYNNVTNHYYIGSATNLANRLARYYRPSELNRIHGSLIHKALLAYGHDRFTIYILETCTIEELISREQYYFELLLPIYNVLKFAASNKGYKHSEKSKRLISEIKLKDPKLIEKIMILAKMNKGKKHSEEFKRLRSELTKGHNNPNFGKGNPVKELDLFSKKEMVYSSVSNAAKARNVGRNQIRYCIKNKNAYQSRYLFEYI